MVPVDGDIIWINGEDDPLHTATSGTDSGDPNSDKIFDTGIISSGLNPFVTIGNAIFISYTPNQDLTAKVQGDCKEYSLGQWMSISRHEIPESVEVNKPRLLAA